MKALYRFIIEPIDGRYNNVKKIGDKNLLLNTELSNHQYVNRLGKVIACPKNIETDIKPGDNVIVHHNVFRRFYDIRGKEKNSSSYFTEDKFFCSDDQVFLYQRNGEWLAPNNYCFVQPIEAKKNLKNNIEEPLVGIMRYSNKEFINMGLTNNTIVGFAPSSEYEFIIDKQRLYRVFSHQITIKYGAKRNEKAYNPSWI